MHIPPDACEQSAINYVCLSFSKRSFACISLVTCLLNHELNEDDREHCIEKLRHPDTVHKCFRLVLYRYLVPRYLSALVSTRCDYCNALHPGLSQSSLRLQLEQNVAATLKTDTRRFERIAMFLAARHWVPVKFRINFIFNFMVWHLASSVRSLSHMCQVVIWGNLPSWDILIFQLNK